MSEVAPDLPAQYLAVLEEMPLRPEPEQLQVDLQLVLLPDSVLTVMSGMLSLMVVPAWASVVGAVPDNR